jgi:hypothetical protein
MDDADPRLIASVHDEYALDKNQPKSAKEFMKSVMY